MNLRTITFGDEGQAATRELVRAFGPRVPPGLAEQLKTFEAIDRRHGGVGALALEDAAELADAAIVESARLGLDELTIGITLWAIRHELAMRAVAPVVNALANRSNAAKNREQLAAAFGLMQALATHVTPLLAADLERSDPERPWRVLHVNMAITAIRTEDPAMMSHAFDALDRALPDERAGFYAEAMALALAPRIAPAVREAIEARHRNWTQA